MEHLLQKVSGAKVMSFLDAFSGFNQIVVHPDDQEKTAFTTPWGTFMYAKMPFRLMNVGATFQRAMDIEFVGEKDKFVLIYLDDITVYSSSDQNHLQHLKKVFLKCRRFGISINPKKSQFALNEGKLLGHVVSAAGVQIDPKRVKAIQALTVPRSKKDVQSFLGKINFVRRFMLNFAELVKHITSMLRKGSEVRWTDAVRKSFDSIKKSIMEAPTLISPNYSKEFHIFSFASEDSLAVLLLQVDEEGSEHPVAFFSKTLRDFELRREKWIAKMIEFNIELRPTKLIKGQGLAKLLAEENCRSLDIDFLCTIAENGQVEEEEIAKTERKQSVAKNLASCNRYVETINFLLKLEIPSGLSTSQARTLKLRAAKYCIMENLLYWRDPSGIFLRCLDKEKSIEVMQQFHSSMCGGHDYWKTTAHKILRAGYYWPTLFFDVFVFVKSCERCQRFEGKQQLKSLPLKPIQVRGPFQQWGLDFIGEINPHSSGQHRWILVANDYFTKWIEAIPTKKADHNVVMKFLTDNIITRVTIKRSIGSSPFELVYGTKVIFPIQLTLPVAKFLQIEQDEEEEMENRITDLGELHQIREQLVEKAAAHQKKIKEVFDKKAKANNFQIGDLVLKWDALKEKKVNHGKFNAFWTDPFIISQIQGNNTFILKSMGGEAVFDGLVNGCFLKIYVF
eukprot:PITA_22184